MGKCEMKILVAGATGVIGRRLVPLLVKAGHEVAGLTRSPAKARILQGMGAKPVIADALDPLALLSLLRRETPDVVVHELTSIKKVDLRHFDWSFAVTNRLRTEGTDYLLAAARAAGVRRFVAQSFAGWPYAREGGPVKAEDAPLDRHPPPLFRLTLEAIRHLESAVTGETALEGIVLRYGSFYGPGTAISETGWLVEDIRNQRVPVIGGGGGIWSFIHIEDAARWTLAAIEQGAPGIYNIVDDDPAPVAEWLPFLAQAVGAQPPHRIPAWIGRFLIGDSVMFMTEVRGASNQKAKQTFPMILRWPSWREGFRGGLGGPLPPYEGRSWTRQALLTRLPEFRVVSQFDCGP